MENSSAFIMPQKQEKEMNLSKLPAKNLGEQAHKNKTPPPF
jgi:hypothetical protein